MADENEDQNKPDPKIAELEQKLADAITSIGKLEAKNRELAQEKSEAKKAADEAALAAAEKSGDVESIRASLEAKHGGIVAEKDAAIERLNGVIKKITVGAKAQSLAAKMAVDPESAPVIQRFIEDRLSGEVKDNDFMLTVLSADGKPTALNLDDLEAEMRAQPHLKRLIAAVNSSGGGAAGSGAGGHDKRKFADYSSTELVELKQKNPALYDRLRDEKNQAAQKEKERWY